MCETERLVLSGEHIRFILLKPRSHSAVLTGNVCVCVIISLTLCVAGVLSVENNKVRSGRCRGAVPVLKL